MSTALAVHHGKFGRATVYRLDRPLAPHAHREGHLIFQIGGVDSEVTIAGKRHGVSRDSAAAVNPWQTHAFHPGDPVSGTLFLVLYINPIWFIEVGGDDSALSFGRSCVDVDAQLATLVDTVAGHLLNEERGDSVDADIYDLTSQSYDRTWQSGTRAGCASRDWPRVSDYRIRNSLRIMRERIGDQIVLDYVARDSGLSRPHFYKLFRQNIGLTPNIYLNTLKMELSIDRLSTTQQAVTSIGLDLGFSSQASFTRFFTSNVGIPPTIYRRASMVQV